MNGEVRPAPEAWHEVMGHIYARLTCERSSYAKTFTSTEILMMFRDQRDGYADEDDELHPWPFGVGFDEEGNPTAASLASFNKKFKSAARSTRFKIDGASIRVKQEGQGWRIDVRTQRT